MSKIEPVCGFISESGRFYRTVEEYLQEQKRKEYEQELEKLATDILKSRLCILDDRITKQKTLLELLKYTIEYDNDVMKRLEKLIKLFIESKNNI